MPNYLATYLGRQYWTQQPGCDSDVCFQLHRIACITWRQLLPPLYTTVVVDKWDPSGRLPRWVSSIKSRHWQAVSIIRYSPEKLARFPSNPPTDHPSHPFCLPLPHPSPISDHPIPFHAAVPDRAGMPLAYACLSPRLSACDSPTNRTGQDRTGQDRTHSNRGHIHGLAACNTHAYRRWLAHTRQPDQCTPQAGTLELAGPRQRSRRASPASKRAGGQGGSGLRSAVVHQWTPTGRSHNPGAAGNWSRQWVCDHTPMAPKPLESRSLRITASRRPTGPIGR
ncbi:hypothetical protein F4780DRAFT_213225 [Xylariomycetidae sp. FL0641]|nr:hypothetical protein F4780DRAFT_213225 [Xylariomycetidae sp. FL0641]